MNMIVGTAIAGTAIASQPAAAADDPIFAAIDAHRAAVDARNSIIGVHSILEDELPRDKRRSSVICFEEDIVETDDPRWIDAERGVSRAWDTDYSIAVDLLNVRRPEYSHCNQARRLTPRRVFFDRWVNIASRICRW